MFGFGNQCTICTLRSSTHPMLPTCAIEKGPKSNHVCICAVVAPPCCDTMPRMHHDAFSVASLCFASVTELYKFLGVRMYTSMNACVRSENPDHLLPWATCCVKATIVWRYMSDSPWGWVSPICDCRPTGMRCLCSSFNQQICTMSLFRCQTTYM